MQAGVYTVQGSLHTGLPCATVLDVLTDYGGLSRIYSTIERSRLVQTSGRREVIQVGAWLILLDTWLLHAPEACLDVARGCHQQPISLKALHHAAHQA